MNRAQKKAMLAPRAIQVAALPWRLLDDAPQVMLVTSRRSRRWLLPKGWQIEGKDLAQSALTEAFEEAGVLGTISSQPIGSYRYLKQFDNGHSIPSQALVFGLAVTQELTDWPEIRQRSRAWFSLEDAAAQVQAPGLAQMLRQLGLMERQLFSAEAVR
tara:strand:- start:861 stop:1334 length:474 start_codon:yes stop_codon:yes gene_type:complete